MKVTVIGTGFVGVVSGAVLADLGHTVWGLDIDEGKIQGLNQGVVPFFEPGLEQLVKKGLASKRLGFTTDYETAISGAEVILLAVGTPSAKDGTADVSYVLAAARELAPFLEEKAIVAIKSTVPPSTNSKVKAEIEKKTPIEFYVASLPEFLREGNAVLDTQKPDRIVIGASDEYVVKRLLKMHEGLPGKRVVVAPESAQMAKYTANAYLAQRITFINQIANICEKNGAHINEVIEAIGYDKRIGTHYWYPGLGYGGSCFPKDVKELAAYAKSIGEGEGLLPKIDELNEGRMGQKLQEYEKKFGGFKDRRVAVLGLSFKPNTNDTRFAPSLVVIPYLLKKRAQVVVFDPKVKDEALTMFDGITLAEDPYQAVVGAEVIVLLTEWKELVNLEPDRLAKLAAPGAVLIDTRNQYRPHEIEKAGLQYMGIGNPS
jgi:UDPglucose 6-dehydrogenase